MAPGPVFQRDERVLCFHHELLYEAKVLDLKLSDPADKKSAYLYKVHYKGWKNTWDDWVPQERLRKHTEENLELARNLKREMDAINNQNKPTPKATVNKSGRKNSEARGSEERSFGQTKKRGRDLDTEREDQYNAKPAIRIPISDTIKSLLVDDWENITKNLQLVKVPSDTPVNKILDDYMVYEKSRRSGETVEANGENDSASRSVELLEEVIAGLREYFNRALGRILLYRYERGQYEDVLGRMNNPNDDLSGKTIGDVYGAEHLLRLYVSLPELMAQTNMDRQSVARVREELGTFNAWMSKAEQVKKYMSTPYESQGAEYQERMFSNPNKVAGLNSETDDGTWTRSDKKAQPWSPYVKLNFKTGKLRDDI